MTVRRRVVPAREPDAAPECRLTPETGRQRQASIDRLFARLAGQRDAARGTEFTFQGNGDELWDELTAFVDEESICCPFFSFEQRQVADGVVLLIEAPASRDGV